MILRAAADCGSIDDDLNRKMESNIVSISEWDSVRPSTLARQRNSSALSFVATVISNLSVVFLVYYAERGGEAYAVYALVFCVYRARNKGLYVVARNFFMLLLNCSA